MYELLKKIFPICRSITGKGVRETLNILKEECSLLNIYEIPSGTPVFLSPPLFKEEKGKHFSNYSYPLFWVYNPGE